MARNSIQFQKGMSLMDFHRDCGSEEQCWRALVTARWPDGFVCPHCSGRKNSFCEPRKLFQCSGCGIQTSIRAGTIFHHSKLPLTKWFLGIYFMTQSKNGISALELMRHLDVEYNTARLMKQKLREVMLERNAQKPLEGRIEMDDAYLGGEREGKPGRGAQGKLPFVAAVATREGRPTYVHLRRVAGFTREAIGAYAKANLTAGSEINTDGLECFSAVTEAGCKHIPTVTSRIYKAHKLDSFRWVNTVLGNVKTAIRSTFRAVNDRHSNRQLAEFEYRINRRFDLAAMIPRLVWAAVRTEPRPYRWLVPADAAA